MTATMDAVELDEDHYSDDSFQDDFESDSEATPLRPAPRAEPMTSEEASPARAAESTSSSTRSSTSSTTASSSAAFASGAAAAAATQSSRDSSVLHSGIKSQQDATAMARDAASPTSMKSSKSSTTSSATSHRSSHNSTSRSGAEASHASQHGAAFPTDAAATAVAAHAEAEEDEEEVTISMLPADQVHDKGHQACADGSHSHAAREPTPQGLAASTHNSTLDQQRLRRPAVPESADELREMQADNTRLREELFQRSRDQYHLTLTQSTKAGTANTFNGNRTVGGAASSRKSAMASTSPSAQANAAARHREATARLVQESLNLHRSLQAMRIEQRELLQRREELQTLVNRYRKALKYKGLVEAAKQDIIDLTEDHRDAHLEVRCNEKLLVLNDAMTDTGTGQRRLQEEIRAQNALTQRRREHALRDADSAQRMRDAAAMRVEELKAEVAHRREATKDGDDTDCLHLRALNQAKKDRVRELRAKLEHLQQEQRGAAAPAAHGKGGQQGHTSKSHLHQQNIRDDAEREYLQNRIAEMRRELEANVRGQGARQAAPTEAAGTAGGLSRHSSRRTDASVAAATATQGPAASTIPPPVAAAAEAPVAQHAQEIDVTAWLNAHPVEPVVAGPSTDTAEALRNSREMDGAASAPGGAAHAYPDEPAVPTPAGSAYKEDRELSTHPHEEEHKGQPASAAASAAASRVSPTENDTPAWLGGGEPEAEDAPAGQPAEVPSYAEEEEEAEEDPMEEEEDEEEEEELGEEEEEYEETESSYNPASAPAPHQQSIDLDEAMFGIGAGHAAPTAAAPAPAAAPTSDDGPDWLNF